MRRRTIHVAGGLVAAARTANAASAQQTDAPADPIFENPATRSAEESLGRPATDGIAVAPVGAPGAAVQEATLIREGARIVDRQGILRPLRGGSWAFVFDRDETGDRDEPMVVLPSTALTEMRRLVETSSRTVTFRLSGRVFAYRGRNYVLPTFFGTVWVSERDEAASGGEEAGPAAAEALLGGGDEDDPTIAEILERLEEAETPAGPRPPRTGVPTTAEAAEREGTLVREGEMVVNRRGRLVRGGRGWAFVPDTDVDEPAGSVQPLRLMPCSTLEAMERAVERFGDQALFVVSGSLFVYERENHLLPTLYVLDLDRTGNLTPAQ